MSSSTRRSTWALLLLGLVLAVGVAMAVRLVRHHEVQVYGDAMAALGNCPQTETINCEIVNTSAWSEAFGLPIATFAIPTYLLLLGLILFARRDPALLDYAFSIGLLTVGYSAFLLWVSSTRIGYVCLWCMGLYAINLSIPILVGVAAWRSPFALVSRTMNDLLSWPRSLRFTTAAFAALLAGTVAGEKAYHHAVMVAAAGERQRIEEQGGPLLPAVPPSETAPDATPNEPSAPSSGGLLPGAVRPGASVAGPMPLAAILPTGASLASLGSAIHAVTVNPMALTVAQSIPYRFAGPFRRLGGSSAKLDSQPFDLQARLGKGKPVALLFWAPEFPDAERGLVTLAKYLAQATPQIETYAVSGRRDEQQDEEIWERFAMLDLPPALPLLIDDKFLVSQALTTTDVPDLALFDGRGALVVAKIKDLRQVLVSSDFGNIPAEALLRKVAAGEPVDQIKNMFPYYPSSRLVGHCAPAFTAKKFNSTEAYNFTGKSPSGKPTLVMFWSSTCKHCQQEIPQMVDWVKKHPGVVDIVTVTHLKRENNTDTQHRKVTEAYIREQKIPWLVLEDPDNAIGELYESVSTPTTYIVSPGSAISEIWYYAHQGNFGEALERALGKARAAGNTCNPPADRPSPRLDFTVTGPDGKRVPMTSLLDRPALVHFWATWCAPCVAELPSVLRLRDRLEKSGAARVILVSVEDEAAGPAIAAFGKKQNLDLRSYRAPSGGLAGKVDLAHRVPRTYMVATGGQVLGLRQGSQDWDDTTLFARVQSRLAVLGGGTSGMGTPAKSAGQ